jgi:hypothetical protein
MRRALGALPVSDGIYRGRRGDGLIVHTHENNKYSLNIQIFIAFDFYSNFDHLSY